MSGNSYTGLPSGEDTGDIPLEDLPWGEMALFLAGSGGLDAGMPTSIHAPVLTRVQHDVASLLQGAGFTWKDGGVVPLDTIIGP